MQTDVLEASHISVYDEGFGLPKILVIGCGGAGNNAVSRLALSGLSGARTLAINTDRQQLEAARAEE
ncbi:MAG TPA: cell division protein FtsZ, partial [Methanothrix sp.]|nr:cell division protein FtsZ [Methanothrix sp.]